MNNTVLQVPLSTDLREKSEKAAVDMGFSSLQEAVRLFLKKLSLNQMVVTFAIPEIKLSAKNERRYAKTEANFEKNKSKYRSFTKIDDMMKYLDNA